MPEPFPPQTWPEGATPAVDQLRAWIRTFNPQQHDARIAADMIAGMWDLERRAHRQTRYTLELRQAAVQKYAGKAKRYRLAWLAARARARGLRAGIDQHLRGGV